MYSFKKTDLKPGMRVIDATNPEYSRSAILVRAPSENRPALIVHETRWDKVREDIDETVATAIYEADDLIEGEDPEHSDERAARKRAARIAAIQDAPTRVVLAQNLDCMAFEVMEHMRDVLSYRR